MESSKFAELVTANFDLNRSLLQLQSAHIACNLTALKSHIAVQATDLALIRYQQAQLFLALEIARSQSSQEQLMIATEIELPEPLFRRLQALLDVYPNESIDSLFRQALETYLSRQPA